MREGEKLTGIWEVLCGTRKAERELLFRWDGWCMGFREFMSDAELGAELLFRWDGWCMGFREFMSDAEFGAGAPFPLDLSSLWVE